MVARLDLTTFFSVVILNVSHYLGKHTFIHYSIPQKIFFFGIVIYLFNLVFVHFFRPTNSNSQEFILKMYQHEFAKTYG